MNNKGLIITASSLLVAIIGLSMYIALWADDVAYKKAVEKNSIKSYREFLAQYPNSEFATDVQKRYDECDYHRVKNRSVLNELRDYIKEHPHSVYADSVKAIIEVFAFSEAQNTEDPTVCMSYLQDYPNSPNAEIIQGHLDDLENKFYAERINIGVERRRSEDISQYFVLFSEGKYKNEVEAKNKELLEYKEYCSAKESNSRYDWERYLDRYPKGKYASIARAKIMEDEEKDRYLNNSLSNGSQPYSRYYGSNYSNGYDQSAVSVKASSYSDVVVIVHYNNGRGKVAGHVYVRKGCSSTIYLPSNRTYQVFFYYGSGWYPKKEMPQGMKGGFLAGESFSKDGSPIFLRTGEMMTYTLTQQVNGNFSTSSSSEYEVF